MGIFERGFALFEYTNQRIWDLYDVITSAPTIMKMFQNNNKRRNRRKERGIVGSLQKRSTPVKKQQSSYRFRVRDSDNNTASKDQKVPAPVKPAPAETTAVPEAPEKIKKLETELSKLREEINKLMANPKAASSAPIPPPMMGGTCGTVSFPSQPVVPPSFVPPPTPTTSGVPPAPGSIPPPPAPPPMPSLNATPSKPRAPPAERMMTKRHVQQKGTLSLAEVLKGASSTNLRKTEVDRSPGGTPLDTPTNKKKPAANPSDPQEIIAMALKKRFQSLHMMHDTPESTKKGGRKTDDEWSDNDSSYSSSPEKKTPIKRTPLAARKSKLFTPVQDENAAPLESILYQ